VSSAQIVRPTSTTSPISLTSAQSSKYPPHPPAFLSSNPSNVALGSHALASNKQIRPKPFRNTGQSPHALHPLPKPQLIIKPRFLISIHTDMSPGRLVRRLLHPQRQRNNDQLVGNPLRPRALPRPAQIRPHPLPGFTARCRRGGQPP